MSTLELRLPPVLVTAITAGLMWGIAALTPTLRFDAAGRGAIAIAFFVAGLAVGLAAIVSFHRAATTVNPIQPGSASSLVTSGIYRITRNPMYLGLVLVLLGWATWLGHPFAVVIVPLFMAYMSRFQIQPEERALKAKFGDSFETYARATRRWL